MSINVHLMGESSSGGTTEAKVTPTGALVTAPISYDDVSAQTLTTNNTPVNFFGPKVGKQFVVTAIFLTADSNVTGSTLVDVYEATDADETTIAKAILHVEILKNGSRDFLPMNLLVTSG